MYFKDPLEVVGGVPVFSPRDSYVLNYEKIASDDIAHLEAFNSSPFMRPAQTIDAERHTRGLVVKHVSTGAKILDAGLGLGGVLSSLPELRRYGVDVALPYLLHARGKGIHVAMAKIEELPYFDNQFDAVLCTDVLEHVFRLDSVTSELLRVLKPGGFLIVRTPNEEFLDSYLVSSQSYAHSHVRTFSLASLRLHFETCFGMSYVEHEFVGFDFTIASQLKYRFPEQRNRVREIFHALVGPSPELQQETSIANLRKLLESSLEEQVDATIELKSKFPSHFEMFARELLHAQELICVFKKEET